MGPGGRGMCRRDLLDAWLDEQQQAESRWTPALNPLNKVPQQPGGRLPRGPVRGSQALEGLLRTRDFSGTFSSVSGTFQGFSAE